VTQEVTQGLHSFTPLQYDSSGISAAASAFLLLRLHIRDDIALFHLEVIGFRSVG
jgi:hypothetical protein